MKKIALAAAISVLAGSASAATVFEGKGLTYKVKGDWQVQYRKEAGEDEHAEIEFDDLELKNSIIYDLGDGLKAIGQLDFGFKDAAENKQDGSDLEEAYLGLDFGNTTVKFGKMDYATDEFGVEMAYETHTSEDVFDDNGAKGDDVVRVDVELDAFTLVASYEIEAEGEDSEDDSSFDLFAAGEFGDFTAGLAFQDIDDSDNTSAWGVFASFDAGIATVAFDYSDSDSDSTEVDVWNLAASFAVNDQTKVAVGYVSVDEEGSDDVAEWYTNVTYKFANQKNVSVFAEIADTDEDDVSMGYLAGMRVKF